MRVTMTSNIHQVTAQVHSGSVSGVTKSAHHVLGVSQGVVPLEEGTLERSGRVDVDADAVVAAVSYGGDNEQLGIVALVQHEDLTLRHAPGRTGKYLEGPLMAEADTVAQIEAAEVRRALR